MKNVVFAVLLVVTLAFKGHVQLPSCDGCFVSQGGADYECCNNQRMMNGVCTCSGGPCTQCSATSNDSAVLPSCGGCAVGFNDTAFACCQELSLENGHCACNGGPCTECAEEKASVPQSSLPACPSNCWSQINSNYFTCPGSSCGTTVINNQCYCDSTDQPCQPCSR